MAVASKPKSKGERHWRTHNAGRLMFQATDLFERDLLRSLHESGFVKVTRVHLALFRNLDLEGTRLTEIASRASTTKQNMQELVDKAEALGLVSRRPEPRDRRAKIVAFTPAGLRMLAHLRRGVAAAEQRMEAAMGVDFLARMKAALAGYLGSAELAANGEAAQAYVAEPHVSGTSKPGIVPGRTRIKPDQRNTYGKSSSAT